MADFDGDGSADIATANHGSSDVSVLLNTTNGVSPVAVDDAYDVNEDYTLDVAARPTWMCFGTTPATTVRAISGPLR